jgi:hypothetical protein
VMPVVCGGGKRCFRAHVRVAEVGWLDNLGELRRVCG